MTSKSVSTRRAGWILLLVAALVSDCHATSSKNIITEAPVPELLDDGYDTYFEASGGLATPRYRETVQYCFELALESPWLHLTDFGESPQGRQLLLLIADRDGHCTPGDVRAAGKAVLLLQAGIHAGEIDGKDAGLMLLRDIAVRKLHPHLLDHLTILFVPIFNVDGHERFGPDNRANQNGPAEMGWRVTAQGYNLNRDFVKADAPEMRAWLELYTAWLPDFLIDSHVTDGADFRHVVMYGAEIGPNVDPDIAGWTRDLYLPELVEALTVDGYPPMPYGGFRRWQDPRSGIRVWSSGPRYSQGYAVIQNRPALLLETHMFKDHKTRVDATYKVFLHTAEIMDRHHAALRAAVTAADLRVRTPAFRRDPFPLALTVDEGDSTRFTLLGYEYGFVDSDITGGRYPVYSDTPADFEVPLFDRHVPASQVRLPEAYLIPPEWTEVIDRLELHGVEIRRLRQETRLRVASVRFEDVSWREHPYEGRHTLTYETVPVEEERIFPRGTAVVDMGQRAARVAAHLLAPEAPDALLRWGFFDTVFERKEYVEPYVLEPLLPGMIEANPALADSFAAALAADCSLEENYWGKILWFYRHTRWWDDRIGVYPVGWVFVREKVAALRYSS
jgi:murein tripeptide amidase MpaA